MDYPLSQGAGIPKNPVLKIEVLEKQSDVRFDSKPDAGKYVNA